MNAPQESKYNGLVNSLRRRARSLRRQALWMQQAFMEGGPRRASAEIVHEVLALREESRSLDQLATRYERRIRQGGLPA